MDTQHMNDLAGAVCREKDPGQPAEKGERPYFAGPQANKVEPPSLPSEPAGPLPRSSTREHLQVEVT